MSEQRRWIEEDATQAERRLLLSARDDGPTRGSRERLFVALGIGGATALGAAAATATATQLSAAGSTLAASGAAAALSKAVPSGAGVTVLAVMKWVGVGAIAGLVTTGSANLIDAPAAAARAAARGEKAADERNARTSAAFAPAAPAAPPTPAETPAIEQEISPPPAPAAAAPAVQRVSVPKPVAGIPVANVGKEVSTLDRAREALAAGDTPSAFRALGQHESEFASGVLGPEAELLRIQALLARREYNSAAVMARGFLMKNPKSPHVGRVRALLAQAKSATAPVGSSE
jgi:hypothetical protein